MFKWTREQRMLAAAGVLLLLTGFGVKHWREKHPPPQVSHVQSSNLNASR